MQYRSLYELTQYIKKTFWSFISTITKLNATTIKLAMQTPNCADSKLSLQINFSDWKSEISHNLVEGPK